MYTMTSEGARFRWWRNHVFLVTRLATMESPLHALHACLTTVQGISALLPEMKSGEGPAFIGEGSRTT